MDLLSSVAATYCAQANVSSSRCFFVNGEFEKTNYHTPYMLSNAGIFPLLEKEGWLRH